MPVSLGFRGQRDACGWIDDELCAAAKRAVSQLHDIDRVVAHVSDDQIAFGDIDVLKSKRSTLPGTGASATSTSGSADPLGARLKRLDGLFSLRANAGHACPVPMAHDPAASAVGIVRRAIDAHSGAACEACVAGRSATATRAGGSPVRYAGAHRAASSAVFRVAIGAHANVAAADEWECALETARPRANGHCVWGSAAGGAALAAVRSVAAEIHARATAVGLGTALGCARSCLAHHAGAASRAALAAVVGIRLQVYTRAPADRVAVVAAHAAARGVAHRGPVRRGRTHRAALPAVCDVGAEPQASRSARRISCGAAHSTTCGAASWAAVSRRGTRRRAGMAIHWVSCDVHARSAAVLGACRAIGDALASRTDFTHCAGVRARAAIGGVVVGADAQRTALGKPLIAGARTGPSAADSHSARRRVASLPAGAAV